MSSVASENATCVPPKRHVGLWIGGGIVAAITVVALLSLVWTPYDPAAIAIDKKLLSPSWGYWLGTDQLGRDTLSMTMAGTVASMSVSLGAVGLGLLFGVPLGSLAAARRGIVGDAIMRANDFVFAFPVLIVAILLRISLGPGVLNVMIAIGLFNTAVFARVAYGAALPLWTKDFILAARAAGKSKAAIAFEHVLPNMTNGLIVQATVQLSLGILAEAALSYLGFGVQPPMQSWGRMLAEAPTLMLIAPRLAIVPGLMIVIAVMALNMLGDGLRDRLDPRLSRER